MSQSFFERGVSSVAAPVRDGSGRIVAAINVTSVDSANEPAVLNGRIRDLVLAASAEITQWSTQASAGRPQVWDVPAKARMAGE